jgi:hypothetical protein
MITVIQNIVRSEGVVSNLPAVIPYRMENLEHAIYWAEYLTALDGSYTICSFEDLITIYVTTYEYCKEYQEIDYE